MIESKDFVPLHGHSFYSILDGLNSPEDIVLRAVEAGYPAIAITDHGVCSSLYRFEESCKKAKQCQKCSTPFIGKNSECPNCKSTEISSADIKPILGMEGYIVEDVDVFNPKEKRHHITLLAKNQKGYENLIWLSTYGNTSGFYMRPRISYDLLASKSEGLIVGTACVAGPVCDSFYHEKPEDAEKYLSRLKDIFAEDLYAEFMNHVYFEASKEHQKKSLAAMKKTVLLADKMGVKSIFTHDFHYCRKEDYFCHDVLLAIQTRNTIKNPKRMTFNSDDFYIKSIEESVSRCFNRKDLILNTREVSDKIEKDLLFRYPFQDLLPNYALPAGVKSELQYIKILIKEGMEKRGVFNKQAYRDRINSELEVIVRLGFVRYFLVLWDAVNYAKTNGIRVGAGRGSAAGSLVMYCLGVTQVDPIKHGLFFERFINPDRISPPDVDVDYDDSRQEDMFKYVSSKYGSSHVARIGTYGTLGAKDSIRTVGKALDVGNDWNDDDQKSWKTGPNTNEIVGLISKSIDSKPGITLKEVIASGGEIQNYINKYPELFDIACKVEGTIRSSGEHAAGVVLCNRPLTKLIPLRRDKGEEYCSQFDKDEVEPLGLLKYDFLGLKNLRTLDLCVNLIKQRTGVDIDIDALETNDKNVFTMLNKGMVHGIFQFEGKDGRVFGRDGKPSFRSIGGLLVNIRVDSFDDMIVCTSLYRPGTLKGVWDEKSIPETYCDYKHGVKPPKYLHPKMENLLADTYGLMVYQEQVMLVAREIAGFSMAEADAFRKGIGKKDLDLIENLKGKFVEGCLNNELSSEDAYKVFELCQSFSGYGFNKAHAACYAFIGYQCAWLKYYYPLEFACALLTTHIGNDKLEMYERVFEKMKINILPCHINKSKEIYTIEGNALRKPLTSFKGIGSGAAVSIAENQPFIDLQDFVSKVDGRLVTKSVFENFVNIGAMDCFGMSRSSILHYFQMAKKESQKIKQEIKKQEQIAENYGSLDLFGMGSAGL